MNMLDRVIKWLSDHRYMLCMKPKGWTEQDENDYLAWSQKQ